MKTNPNGNTYKIELYKYNKEQYDEKILNIQQINLNIDSNNNLIYFDRLLKNVVKELKKRNKKKIICAIGFMKKKEKTQ